ncbi:hypothetical protein OESDEN_07404 [Oesophagostomum dentatum]|uniref:Uncharacterized protein n=1 Tax=Oesophagostomum dentatum TaxID=61180 RepID=A0A0B1T9A1_OESDE|nr:hypothetical protein OESDEN_07404 [Oesophagostomum dentatum]
MQCCNICKTNGIDEFVVDPGNVEASSKIADTAQSEDSFNDENDVDKPSTRATKVWKPRKNPATLATSSTTASQSPTTTIYTTRRTWTATARPDGPQTTVTPTFETPRTTRRRWTTTTTTEEPATTETTVTRRPTTRRTSTTERTTSSEASTTSRSTAEPTTTHSTTITTRATITTQPKLSTTLATEEFEYEIVEVEVDENGNEIASEKVESQGKTANNTNSEAKKESASPPDAERWKGRQRPLEKQSSAKDKVREERRRLVEEQKRALNLPPDTEVEYVDGDTTRKPDDYEEDADYLGKETQHS